MEKKKQISNSKWDEMKISSHFAFQDNIEIRRRREYNKSANKKRGEKIIMDINQKLTEELGVKKWQVEAAVKLIDEGNTIPFISRYRKVRNKSIQMK